MAVWRKWIVPVGLFGLALSAIGAAQAEEPARAPDLEILELGFSPDGLTGPGGERLRGELADAQFILLGEDHGFAGSPLLGRALAAEARPFGVVHHVVEAGPFSTAQVSQALLDGGLAALDAELTGKPLMLPFLSNREDAELALDFLTQGGPDALWGVDQEFVGSPRLLLSSLLERAPDPATAQLLRQWIETDARSVATGEQGGLMLFAASAADYAALRTAFAGDAEAVARIAALEESAEIYRLYASRRNYASNETRIVLIRRQFLERYRAAPEPAPRVLLKMGASHLGRGLNPNLVHDLGGLLPGISAANDLNSLHIAYLPLGGTVLQLDPGGAKVATFEDETIAPILAAAGIDPASLPETGHVLIPLAPLRLALERKAIEALPAQSRFTLIGFDYLVTTSAAEAATPLGD